MIPLRRASASLAVLVVAAAMFGTSTAIEPAKTGSQAPPAAPAPASIRLTIDYHDGVQKVFTALPHRPGITVFDALTEASRHPRGIALESKGRGETAFVLAIDSLANQGGGKESLNWQFLVNGELAKRGAGVTELKPGDQVTWTFDRQLVADAPGK